MRLSIAKDLTPLRQQAVRDIIALAATERALVATPGKDGIYIAKRAEAERWLDAGQPAELADYPYLTQEVGVTAPTTYELALLWVNLNLLWVNVLGPAIEGREQRAKATVAAAMTPAAIRAAVEAFGS